MRSRWIPTLIMGLFVGGALTLAAQVYPVRLDTEAEAAAPAPAALTIQSFYVKGKIWSCPVGPCADSGWITINCNSGDRATGGSAYSESNTFALRSKPRIVGGVPVGWQMRAQGIGTGFEGKVRVICAEL